MKLMDWKRAKGVATILVVGVAAIQTASAEVMGGHGKPLVRMQTGAGQGVEHERELEAQVAELLADGHYVAVLDMVKQAASPNALMLNEQGVAYEHLGGFESARLSYEESIRLNPKYSNVYNNLGTVYYARHNNKMAIRMYKKAIRLDAKSASAYKNLGSAYFHEGKFRCGSEAFEEAITIDPGIFDRQGLVVEAEDAATLMNMNYFLAQLCAKSGRTDAAIAYLNRAIAQGFRDYAKLQKDEAFAAVRGMPEFPAPVR
jgi:tetratricopeptide (TPR) repeat protein